jgi:hypothetical protein
MGWRGQQDDVGVLDDLLIRVESHKAAFRTDIELTGNRVDLIQTSKTHLNAICKGIAESNQLYIRVRLECLRRGARSSPAATDQTNAQRIAPTGMNAFRDRSLQNGASGNCYRRIRQKLPAGLVQLNRGVVCVVHE